MMLPTVGNEALLRGVHELVFEAEAGDVHPYFELQFQVSFIRPDGEVSIADGFYDGDQTFRARAYTDTAGMWEWHATSNVPGLDGCSGTFRVIPSDLPGKLRLHPDDPYQFAFDDGSWFLHLGDTGYRYVTASEPHWQTYIDQAAEMGATKIRTWFCEGRGDVQVLFDAGRTGMNLPYWQEIDRRMAYAAATYPRLNFKLIPYGEDTDELLRYDEGDAASYAIAKYAQARLSAFPNVTWCVSNDREIVEDDPESGVVPLLEGRQIKASTIDRIATDMRAREPWGTLLMNHQCRFKGYSFCDREWSDVVILEDLDQAHGGILLDYREKVRCPVVNDEDRYETYRGPEHPRYFFRRLTWGSLLSGGHATYGGLRTFEPYDGDLKGMQGYFDACRDGRLRKGAHDYRQVHQFFRERNLTLVGMVPDDSMVGNDPYRWKCIRDADTVIVYLANPSGDTPETDEASEDIANVVLDLPEGDFVAEWFDPSTGSFREGGDVVGGRLEMTAPSGGDWVLLIRRREALRK